MSAPRNIFGKDPRRRKSVVWDFDHLGFDSPFPWFERGIAMWCTTTAGELPNGRTLGPLRRWGQHHLCPETAERWRNAGAAISHDVTFEVIPEGLAAYEPRESDDVGPLAALLLHHKRAPIESEANGGVLNAACWCISCGAAMRDGRVDRGHLVRHVRKWCDRCCDSDHRSDFRPCAASDCDHWFWTANSSSQVFHHKNCARAEQRRLQQSRAA